MHPYRTPVDMRGPRWGATPRVRFYLWWRYRYGLALGLLASAVRFYIEAHRW